MNVISGSTAGKNAKQADDIIIKWANQTLVDNGKSRSFNNFSDQTLKDSTTILQLVESIKPSSVDWECLESGNHLENARYGWVRKTYRSILTSFDFFKLFWASFDIFD